MTFRINANSCKNAMGTVFLLAAAFFVCSTFVSVRSVFADPIAPANTLPQRAGRTSPRANATNRANVSRATVSRATSSRAVTPAATSRSTVSRGGGATRNVTARGNASVRNVETATSRGVTSRTQTANNTRNNRAVRARTATTPSRVSATGSVMAGARASTSSSYSYLASSLYTGSYSNIIDSTTGLISADAYSNCMDSYYTCMDEICTARSDTKGRCSCAGRATNFLESEQLLEKANEELIKLSGQLSLLIATKGKGDSLSAAFSLTDAEKVMNCVSYKENVLTKKVSESDWYDEHPTVTDANGNLQTSGLPKYCNESGNSFGFDIKNIDGSSSDILAQLKSWADAKDLAKDYTSDNANDLWKKYTTISGVVNSIGGVTTDVDSEKASLDSLANKWGYDLFQYAHNNVCGRVLDSCFNGIYEACGTPPTVKESNGSTTHNKCANGATSNCPFNYNSYISVDSDTGDVALNERGTGSSSSSSAIASCFGYSGTSTTTRSGITSTSNDPYATLRGPVADARRSIMQKYLLDANAACDVYGTQLKQTAQNINYQKIAAEQALQQKRLEFKQEEEASTLANATTAASNFDECLSEILECYESQSENTTSSGAQWTLARIKTYCAQISQVPHCYETMICNPSVAQFHAIIDLPDNEACYNGREADNNTCRNIVTISEILNAPSVKGGYVAVNTKGNSLAMREQCLLDAGIEEIRTWTPDVVKNVRCTVSELRTKDPNASAGYKKDSSSEVCEYIISCNPGYLLVGDKCILDISDCTSEMSAAATAKRSLSSDGETWGDCIIQTCKSGYTLSNNTCVLNETDCTSSIEGAARATRTLSGGVWGNCTVQSCKEHYSINQNANKCVADVRSCPINDLNRLYASAGTQTWNGENWGDCVISTCASDFEKVDDENECVRKECTGLNATAGHVYNGECVLEECKTGYTLSVSTNTCVANQN